LIFDTLDDLLLRVRSDDLQVAATVWAVLPSLIGARRRVQLVRPPAERRLFWRSLPVPRTDVVVTFRIDGSDSIRRRIAPVVLFVDLFARALEIAGASFEVVGFTAAA
jgi:cobaltochelatase CobT